MATSTLPGTVPERPQPNTPRPTAATPATGNAKSAVSEQAMIPRTLVIKGEISGSESLYIDGRIEGSVNLAGNRLTVGRNAQVSADIQAREVVVLGRVRGNCDVADRVDVRNEGSLTGDVVCQRISIEEGAFFKGGVDLRKPAKDAEGPVPVAKKA